ncbi:response regulator transcription factor [Micromonospora sp. NPDC093277]|uniref:response regulator transcription factor n=1 Tax=Micromonospora sp. NPDC093277 TaxID=3364291 RepID=UPI0038188830
MKISGRCVPLPAEDGTGARVRILVVEDERRLAGMLAQGLREAGHDVDIRHTGSEGLLAAATGRYDAVALDIMLPGLDGTQVCRTLRQHGNHVPVLMLTTRGEVPDRVAGLDAGADDYLAKPFSFDELLARLRALYRRSALPQPSEVRAGDLLLDPPRRRVFRGEAEIDLSAREFDILTLLMARAGECLTRYQILDEVWDGETDLRSNVIDVHIATLRAKVDKPFGRHAIETLRGVGYRLRPDGG